MGGYCNAGNLIDGGEFIYLYDAWNRLVKVSASEDDDNVTVQTSFYDGFGRRIKKVVTNSGDLDATTLFYYDGDKLIETRNGSEIMVAQFIHGTQYVDELVMMRAADKGDLYYHQDANWNVIALTDQGGHVVERYTYTPYGRMTVNQVTGYGDYNGDGTVNSADKTAADANCSSDVSGVCRIVDFDFDGDYDASDGTTLEGLYGSGRHPGLTSSALGNPFAHQGLFYDPEIESYQNRARQYHPRHRRFLQRDPLGYIDGMSLYGYVGRNPIIWKDPSGRESCSDAIRQSKAAITSAEVNCRRSGRAKIAYHICCQQEGYAENGITVVGKACHSRCDPKRNYSRLAEMKCREAALRAAKDTAHAIIVCAQFAKDAKGIPGAIENIPGWIERIQEEIEAAMPKPAPPPGDDDGGGYAPGPSLPRVIPRINPVCPADSDWGAYEEGVIPDSWIERILPPWWLLGHEWDGPRPLAPGGSVAQS